MRVFVCVWGGGKGGRGGGGDGESFSGYFSKIMDCPSTRGIQFKITT